MTHPLARAVDPLSAASLPDAGPDEVVYVAQADALRRGGVPSLRYLARRFVDRPQLHCFPSPTRWLWLLLVATFRRISPRAMPLASLLLAPLAAVYAFAGILQSNASHTAAWLALALCAASPLLHIVARRVLQDGPVAALTLLCVGCALRGETVGVVVAVAALLSTKEAAIFSLPAVFAACFYGGASLWAVPAGVAAWLTCLAILYGPRLAYTTLRAASRGHDNDYARVHQRGAPHRLVVDLLLLSPLQLLVVAMASAVSSAKAVVVALLLAAHAIAPVRNVRFVLAADLALRCMAAVAVASIHPLLIAPMLIADVAISRAMLAVYDPVTAELCAALRMPLRAK